MIELIDTFDAFDFDELASFQRRAFGSLWFNPERARLQCPQYYSWKYSPPAGPAHLATIRCNGDLAATVAAVPVAIICGRHRRRAWQICDIATDTRFRKRGLFSKCLNALRAASNGEMMFCIPNRQSRAGLAHGGFSAHSPFDVYLSPLFPGQRSRSEWKDAKVDYLETLGTPVPDKESRPHAERSWEFLRWRYRSHPLTRYTYLPVHASDGSDGFVIMRHVRIFGLKLALIMEIWPLSKAIMRDGIYVANRWARQTRCLALLASRDTFSSDGNLGPRWRIMERMIVTTSFTSTSRGVEFTSLLTQIGDWDAL